MGICLIWVKAMRKIILYLIVILQIQVAQAYNLGKRGQTFEIEEESFIEMIKRKLKQIDLKKQQKKMQAIARERIENPIPLEGIREAKKGRVFYFDPTYTLKDDVVLPCGKILHKAGTRVNPLEHMDLDRRLFFIDARNESEIEWLVKQLEGKDRQNGIQDKIILVGGKPFELKKRLEQEVYFDQMGEITGRFGIMASPSVAVQEELRIRIEEIVLD